MKTAMRLTQPATVAYPRFTTEKEVVGFSSLSKAVKSRTRNVSRLFYLSCLSSMVGLDGKPQGLLVRFPSLLTRSVPITRLAAGVRFPNLNESEYDMNTATAVSIPHLVSSQNGKITTTSTIVAQVFGKRHADVLRAIRELECSPEFTERNFALSLKINELANGKSEPFYNITRDGFMFLCMGFTGKEAAQWKEKFIGAFNAMEAKLSQPQQAALPFDTADCKKEIMNALLWMMDCMTHKGGITQLHASWKNGNGETHQFTSNNFQAFDKPKARSTPSKAYPSITLHNCTVTIAN